MAESPEQFDAELRQIFEQGDLSQTATLFLARYGGEITGFLTNRLRSSTKSADVFSEFAEDFWKGLPTFTWRSSLRAWAYALARNAAYRYSKSPAQRLVHQTFDVEGPFGQEVARQRSKTELHARTEVKSRMRELRESLSEEDQSLLMLRVDRKLSWKDLAVALSDGKEMNDTELAKKASNLRQSFQKVKNRLRSLAEEEGLLGGEPSSS